MMGKLLRPSSEHWRGRLCRLGSSLLILGVATAAHAIWGLTADPLVLIEGAAGLLWALIARRAIDVLAGIVLLSVAPFALLDDRGVFTRVADAVALVALAAALVLAHGLPIRWWDAWPVVPTGAIVLVATFVTVRLAAMCAAVPWATAAPLSLVMRGLAPLGWVAGGGARP